MALGRAWSWIRPSRNWPCLIGSMWRAGRLIWTASCVDVFAAMPAGLVALELPAGQFALTVTLEPTQLQSLSWALSGLALLAAAGSFLAWRRIWPEADQAWTGAANSLRQNDAGYLCSRRLVLASFC